MEESQMNVMRSIRVNPVLNGFIVEVGCQTLVFNRIEDVAENLVAYQKDPDGMEKKFAADAVNKTLDNGPVPEPVERLNRNIVRFQPTYGAGTPCGENTSAG